MICRQKASDRSAPVDLLRTPAPESLDLKRCDPAVSSAVKKLLTDQPQSTSFVRGHATSKSFRVERVKGDDLSYIADQHKAPKPDPTAGPSTPIIKPREALKVKMELKKEVTPPTSRVPEPIPAKIPRPKISRYTPPVEHGETPDESQFLRRFQGRKSADILPQLNMAKLQMSWKKQQTD
uniref:Tankyrase_bdg_C domain-containing protein n=1 Tax=Steinernema glaseri TaxID=37863 RepID=A0A1I8A3H7_9BILA